MPCPLCATEEPPLDEFDMWDHYQAAAVGDARKRSTTDLSLAVTTCSFSGIHVCIYVCMYVGRYVHVCTYIDLEYICTHWPTLSNWHV